MSWVSTRTGRRYDTPEAILSDVDALDYDLMLHERSLRDWRRMSVVLCLLLLAMAYGLVQASYLLRQERDKNLPEAGR